MPNSACQTKKKSFLHRIVTGDEKWIYFQNPKEILDWSRLTINIFLKTKSLRTEDDAVRLVGLGGCHLLRAVKTWWNCSRLPPTTDQIAPCSAWKKVASEKTWQADFPPRQRTIASMMVQNYLETLNWEAPYPAYSPDLHFLTITCFRRWATLNSTLILTKTTWWVVSFERWGIFLVWYTQIARKMGKMYS